MVDKNLMASMDVVIVAVDNGNGNTKTEHCVFRTGLDEYDGEPTVTKDYYKINERYYVAGENHMTYQGNKTENDDCYILTMIAVVKELKYRHITSAKVILAYMTGPAPDELVWNNVYNAFMEEKKIWNKLGGRLYNHNVISFHKDENITPEEALEFGKEFAEKWFPDHQSVIAVHKDREHVHIHIVTNTVSYVDGRKLHNSRKDLQRMKDLTNQMCKDRELSIAEKGRHFNGESIEQGELIAWSKDKYNLLNDSSRKSYVTDCAVAILEVLEDICESISDFINAMQDKGWKVNWSDKRKNITFENEKGEKVRDTNISKTFNMNIGKEALIHEFERQKAIREERARAEQEESRRNEELEQYFSELDNYIKAEGSNREPAKEDSRAFIDTLNAKERASAKERVDREAEQRRLDTERQREAERRDRESEEKRRKNKKRLRDKTLDLWD